MRVVLPIYYYRQNSNQELADLGITSVVDEKEIRMQSFFHIDSVAAHSDPQESLIYSSGQVFVCAKSAASVDSDIVKARTEELVKTIFNNLKN